MAKEKPRKKDRKSLTLFIIMIPALLLAMSSSIDNYIVRLGFQIVLFLLQFVLVKNIIESYEGED